MRVEQVIFNRQFTMINGAQIQNSNEQIELKKSSGLNQITKRKSANELKIRMMELCRGGSEDTVHRRR